MWHVYNKWGARARTKVVRRKHIIQPTGFGAYIMITGLRLWLQSDWSRTHDVIIQGYRKSHAKIRASKSIFCSVSVLQNFEWNSKGVLWNFTHNFEPIHRKICIYEVVKVWRIIISWSYDSLSLPVRPLHGASVTINVKLGDGSRPIISTGCDYTSMP